MADLNNSWADVTCKSPNSLLNIQTEDFVLLCLWNATCRRLWSKQLCRSNAFNTYQMLCKISESAQSQRVFKQ